MAVSQRLKEQIGQFIAENYTEETFLFHDMHEVRRETEVIIQESRSLLEDFLERAEETFSDMLLRLIDEKGLTDADAYKKAQVNRKLFSKIRSDAAYRPSKPTVLSFVIALELNVDEAQDLLRRAGFALSPSSQSDLIVEFFIRQGGGDLFAVNEALHAFGENPL